MIITGEIKDPRIEQLTTVTEVKVTRDLGHAKVWVSRFGDAAAVAESVDAPEPRGRVHPGRALQADFAAHLPAAHLPSRRCHGERVPHRAKAAGHRALTEGIILLDKPAGQTSFQSLAELKRRLGTGQGRPRGHPGQVRGGSPGGPCRPHDPPVQLRHLPGQGIRRRGHLRPRNRHPRSGRRGDGNGPDPGAAGRAPVSSLLPRDDLPGAPRVLRRPRRGQAGVPGGEGRGLTGARRP